MTRRALVVEDDESLAELECVLLRRDGFEPVAMHEGHGVVAWVREHRPAVVLLDLMLPDVSGYDLCETLKLDRETNLTPVIIVTARALREDMLHGLAVGANYYLTKPFSADQLKYAVDHVLEWRQELERSGAAGEVHFQLKSDAQYLDAMNKLAASLFLFSGLSEDEVFQLTTAVREMGNNAIEWGNRKQVERPVTVTYRIDPEKLSIVIRDDGPGFDRGNLAHAACLEDPAKHMDVREARGLRAGGFGILMTRGLVDDMQYNEAGNEVRLVKRLQKSAGA